MLWLYFVVTGEWKATLIKWTRQLLEAVTGNERLLHEHRATSSADPHAYDEDLQRTAEVRDKLRELLATFEGGGDPGTVDPLPPRPPLPPTIPENPDIAQMRAELEGMLERYRGEFARLTQQTAA